MLSVAVEVRRFHLIDVLDVIFVKSSSVPYGLLGVPRTQKYCFRRCAAGVAPRTMGATASRSSPPEACDMTAKAVDTPAVLPNASGSDAALRQVLRSLQLSPDLIDKSTAAIYAHVRDPIEHPVDKELARLCTSDYTRGAMQALCLYLVAASSESDGHGNGRNPRKSSFGADNKSSTPSAGAGDTYSSSNKAEQGDSSNSVLTESVSGKLSNFWNRMRRTRSMPSKGVILPTEEGGDKNDDYFPNDQDPPSAADTQPKLNVRVAGAPKSPSTRRANNLLAGLGLGSPSGRAAGEVATPRRAPVRTGHWKLGHEIGKGSFGAVHIGLNEDTGVSETDMIRPYVSCPGVSVLGFGDGFGSDYS